MCRRRHQGGTRLLTSDDTVAPHNDATLSALRAKHPPAPHDVELPNPAPNMDLQNLNVDTDTVLSAVTSMQSSSGAGLDGMRPLYLQQILGADTADRGRRLLFALTSLVNIAMRGAIPEVARDCFFGASLCALAKKDGGIRPVAVGCVYRRLASKIGARYASTVVRGSLQPSQLGVGTPGGCEAVVHAARQFVHSPEHRSIDSIKVLIKVDVKNAFNSLHRTNFLRKILEKCPQVYTFMDQAYRNPCPLYYGRDKLLSETGLQQGDHMASVAFAMAISDAISELNSPFNAWYLDDGTIGGELE